jgi:hypothetical protein
MTEPRKPDDNGSAAGPDSKTQQETHDVPLVGKTEEIDPATVDSMIEDRFEATDN